MSPSSWNTFNTLRWVQAIGVLYFCLSITYSLYFYEHKFLFDGTSLVFDILNYKSFSPSFQREVMSLQQIIPIITALSGGGVKGVMIAYVLNVYVLYFALFATISFKIRDVPMSILFLLVHHRGDPLNYNMMVEELLPGVCFIVLLFALIRNVDAFIEKRWAYFWGAFSVLLIVRSHPLAVVTFALSAPIFLIGNGQTVRKHWRLLIAATLLFTAFFLEKILFLNSYSAGRISEAKELMLAITELISEEHLVGLTWILFGQRWFFIIALVLTVWFLVHSKKYRELTVFLFMLISSTIIFNLGAHDIAQVQWGGLNIQYDRWSLPIRFITFASFTMMVPLTWLFHRKVLLMTLSPIVLGLSLYDMSIMHKVSSDYLVQVGRIIERCREEGVSKAILCTEEIGAYPPVHNTAYRDILVYSTLWGESAIQVVYEDPTEDLSFLIEGTEELIILDRNGALYPLGDGTSWEEFRTAIAENRPLESLVNIDTTTFDISKESYSYISLGNRDKRTEATCNE